MSQEKPFYVYVHRYASGPKEGQVFYVGKGKGGRLNDNTMRNDYWLRVARKYGFNSEVLRRFINENCAFTFEKIAINAYGFDNLTNMTFGGDGVSGHVSTRKKKVYCSNGMVFDSVTDAGLYIGRKSALSGIAAAASGVRLSAYNFLWSYDGFPSGKANRHGNPRPIICSNGKRFKSVKDAAKWIGPNAVSINIIHAAQGKRKTAYGHFWRFE